MSSFIGHTLTSVGIYATTKEPVKLTRHDILWMGWLICVGQAPDIDYIIPTLRALKNDGLRITHSFVVCMVLPLLTVLALSRLNLTKETRRLYNIQVCLAGLSHIVLDMLVGVLPLPLLWPFTTHRFRLPFGILPSAPAFRLDNIYMYRNLLMEVGVLAPLFVGIYLARFSHTRFAALSGWKRTVSIGILGLCSFGFMGWALTLAR